MNLHITSFLDGAAMPALVERAGWVLIHSIWQFSVVAVLLLATERLLARSSAASRYLVSSIALCAMVCCVMATLFFVASAPTGTASTALVGADQELAPPPRRRATVSRAAPPQPTRGLSVAPGDAIASGAEAQPAIPALPELRSSGPTNASAGAQRAGSNSGRLAAMQIRIIQSLRPWLASCVALWVAGMAIAALRLIAGGFRVWRLRRFGTSPVNDEVVLLLAVTAKRLGLRQAVEILQSTLVVGPAVIGWLRPLILLPAASLTGLRTEQLEAVLAHELAHIRRFDYLVNLLQIVVETVFFYHPAIWWVSRRMRIHREDCCDDRAISSVSKPLTYASALLALYELRESRTQSRAPLAVMSATGGSLKKRIHRVLGIDHSLQPAPGWWISTGVVGLMVLIIGWGYMTQSVLSDDKASRHKSQRPPAASPQTPTPNGNPAPARTPEMRERVLEQLESLGVSRLGALDITPDRPPGAEPVAAHLWDVPDAAWPLLAQLDSIQRLDLTASQVSPEAFQHVSRLTSLSELKVVNSRFEPRHLEALAPLQRMQTIDVMFTVFEQKPEERRSQLGELSPPEQARFDLISGKDQHYRHIAEASILTDRALQKLSGLTTLRKLKLINTFVSNAGVEALRGMQDLREIELSVGGNVSVEAASVLGGMKKLDKLTLIAQIDAQAAARLKGAESLKELELRSIDNEVAAVIGEISSLQRLRLWASSLDDAGLLQLAKLPQLRQIDIRFATKGTFTLAGIEKFQAARPGCGVQHDLRIETLSERKIPIPPDLFVIRLYWRKATSREQLQEHVQGRFGKSEHWLEFRPLTRAGYVGGMALVRGAVGRDWLLAQLAAEGDYRVEYAEPLTYKRLKDEGVLFDALLKAAGEPVAAATEVAPRPESSPMPSTSDRGPASIVLPGDSLPSFPELLRRLRDGGQNKTADALQTRFDSQQRRLDKSPRAVMAYGQVVAKSGDPPRLCNAPMPILDGGWFVAGIGDKDQPVGFRMFGCRPVDVVASQLAPGVRPGATVSLGRIVLTPYAPAELATVRGRLKFAGDVPPNGLRARIVIGDGPTNSLSGGTDGYLEWPEKESVTLTDDLRLEHRQLAPLPHVLHLEAPGYQAVRRELDLTAGATLDLGVIEMPLATKFQVEFLASVTSDFADAKLRETSVRFGESWKSNPDNQALAKYPGGDMRFVEFPVDPKSPEGPQKLVIHSGVASLKLVDLGEDTLQSFRVRAGEPPKLQASREVTVLSGHVYLCYHTHWKHWTLLRVTFGQ